MSKEYTIRYRLEATVSFEAIISADSEEEAKAIARENMACEDHEEIDWETTDFVLIGCEEND